MFLCTLRPSTWLDGRGDRHEDPQGSTHGMRGHTQNQGWPPGPTRAGPVPPSLLNCCPLSRFLSVTAGPHVPVDSGPCDRYHRRCLPRADRLGKRAAVGGTEASPGATIWLQGRDLTTQSETGTGKLPQVCVGEAHNQRNVLEDAVPERKSPGGRREGPLGGATVSGSSLPSGRTGWKPSWGRCPRVLGTCIQSHQSDQQGEKAVSSRTPQGAPGIPSRSK